MSGGRAAEHYDDMQRLSRDGPIDTEFVERVNKRAARKLKMRAASLAPQAVTQSGDGGESAPVRAIDQVGV